MLPPSIVQPDRANSSSSDEWNRDEGVRNAAVVLESLNGAGESPEDIEIGCLGGENGSHGGVGRLAVQTCTADAGSSEEVRDRFHNALETIVAE